MSEKLYRWRGGVPQTLPTQIQDENGVIYTAPYTDYTIAQCGWQLAPDKPLFDPATQRCDWDAESSQWIVSALPPPPPVVIPPVVWTIGAFLEQFDVDTEAEQFEELDALMQSESLLVRRNWARESYTFREDDAFWRIVRKHLDTLFTVDRVLEILGINR